MSSRLLGGVLVVQTLLLAALVAERLVPEAHAADGMRCEIANWPDALTGRGIDALRIRVESSSPLPVELRGGEVPIVVKGWQTYDRVRVEP